jgi:hypothetical protein
MIVTDPAAGSAAFDKVERVAADIAAAPRNTRRFMLFMGVVGFPRSVSKGKGRFKAKTGQAKTGRPTNHYCLGSNLHTL